MKTKKEQAIEIATAMVGKVAAASAWNKLCVGHLGIKTDPASEAAFDSLTEADMRTYDIPTGIARAWAPLFATKPATEDKKAYALKEKHRETLGTDVLFKAYVADPKGPAWIYDELFARAREQNCLFVEKATGKPYEKETVQWIEWRRANTPLGEGMIIDNVFMRPVALSALVPAQKHLRDPFASGMAPLTMPGHMSVCGASLEKDGKPVGEDEIRFLSLVAMHEKGSPRDHREACETAKAGLSALLAAYPLAKRAWDDGVRPDATVPARAQTGGIEPLRPTEAGAGKTGSAAGCGAMPLIYVMTGREEVWGMLKEHLYQVEAMGRARVVADVDAPAGVNREDWQDFHENTASAIIVLLSAGTISLPRVRAAAQRAWSEGRKVFPVLVRSCCLDGCIFDGIARLPKHGRAMRDDADAAEIAAEMYKIASGLLVVKTISMGEPAWLSMGTPNRCADAEFIRFRKACERGYDSARSARAVLQEIGANVGSINWDQGIEWIWREALDHLARSGRLRAFFAKATADDNVRAMFAEWR